MAWSKRTRAFVICRCRPHRFKVVEFSLDFSLGYNAQLLNKDASSSPVPGKIESIESSAT